MLICFESLALSDFNDDQRVQAAGFAAGNFVRCQLWGIGSEDDFYVLGTVDAVAAKQIIARAWGHYAVHIAAAAEPPALAAILQTERQFLEDAGVAQCAGQSC